MKALVQSGIALTRGPIARGSIASVIIRVTGLAVSFAQAILAARILGVDAYGIAAVSLSVVQIAATCAVFGFGRLAIREIARHRASGRTRSTMRFVCYSGRWVSILSVLAGIMLVAGALAGLAPGQQREAIVAGSLAILPLALLQLQRGIAQGLGRIVAAQAPAELLRPALFVCFLLVVALVRVPLGAPGYVIAFALAALSALTLSLPFTLRGIGTLGGTGGDIAELSRWRTETMPFFGMALVAIMLGEINTLLLGWFAPPREAGLFQPVARLAPLMALPVQAAGMRFAPRIAELWELKQHAEIERLSRIFRYTTLVLTIATAVSLALAGPWILAAFGSEFVASARLLWIVAAAQVFNAACGPVGMLLTMRGRTNASLTGQVAGLGVNCALGIWLVPEHGALGAAIAMAGGIVVWNTVMLTLLHLQPNDREARQ